MYVSISLCIFDGNTVYLGVLLSGSGLLSLCRSGVIATVLIIILLFLLGSATEHREDVIGDTRGGGGDSRGSSGSSVCSLFGQGLRLSASCHRTIDRK